MTLTVEEEVICDFDFPYKEVAKQVMEKALDMEYFPYEAEVNLTLTDEDTIAQINRQFREIDRATDVLSFPMITYPAGGDFDFLEEQEDIFHPDTGEALLGDIVICVPMVFAQAREYGHSNKREFAFLVAHSMLHLMGYDHMNEEESAVMEEKQEKILLALGIKRG